MGSTLADVPEEVIYAFGMLPVTLLGTHRPLKKAPSLLPDNACSLARSNLELVLADGTVHPEKGRVTVVGRGVDPTTGTLPIQAEFPNPNGVLRPGQFARIRVPLRIEKSAVVVPQRAIQEVQGTYNVAVVNPDSTIEIRPVKVTHGVGDEGVVGSGLTAGERIVVEGLQKVRQGAKARPMEAGAAAGASAGAR